MRDGFTAAPRAATSPTVRSTETSVSGEHDASQEVSSFSRAGSVARGWLIARRRARGPGYRQFDDEARPLAHGAPHMDAARMRLDDMLGDVQAQSQAAHLTRSDEPLEALEDPVLILRGNARPTVLPLQQGVVALSPGTHLERGPGRVLEDVGQQVGEHLLHPIPPPLPHQSPHKP